MQGMVLHGPGCGFTALRPKRAGVNESCEARGIQITDCSRLELFQLSNSLACQQMWLCVRALLQPEQLAGLKALNGLGLADEA